MSANGIPALPANNADVEPDTLSNGAKLSLNNRSELSGNWRDPLSVAVTLIPDWEKVTLTMAWAELDNVSRLTTAAAMKVRGQCTIWSDDGNFMDGFLFDSWGTSRRLKKV